MRIGAKIRATTLLSAVLVGFDSNYLAQGGPPAALWLAGAAATSPAVRGARIPGRGADHTPAPWSERIGRSATPEELETDVSKTARLTWGCGGDLEWRGPATGSPRLTADTITVCGVHDLRGREVRLTIRAHRLELRAAEIRTFADGFFDLRAEQFWLEGESRVTSRARASAAPPFSASANVSVSAHAVEGPGRLEIETFGADYRAE